METAVGACNGVRYSVDIRYWECPLTFRAHSGYIRARYAHSGYIRTLLMFIRMAILTVLATPTISVQYPQSRRSMADEVIMSASGIDAAAW